MASLLTVSSVSLLLRPRAVLAHHHNDRLELQMGRRELVLRTSELASLAAIFHFRNLPSLSIQLMRQTNTEGIRNYNPEDGRRKTPIRKDEAKKELLQVIASTKPDNFTPKIVDEKDDYICVEYESPIMGFVDDVEFWFPPGKKSIVEYRSASRLGNFDFNINKKRIKALRLELEKRGWASESNF